MNSFDIEFRIPSIPQVDIKTVSLEVVFNHYRQEQYVMSQDGAFWTCSAAFPPGEYLYHLLLNDHLFLNDVNATWYKLGEDGRLMSVLKIDAKGTRLYNKIKQKVIIDHIGLASQRIEDRLLSSKKEFNVYVDKMVVMKLDLNTITGIHSLTSLWCTPQNNIFETSEHVIHPLEEDDILTVWFWMDFQPFKKTYPPGNWNLKLLIDGAFLLQIPFKVDNCLTYSPQAFKHLT